MSRKLKKYVKRYVIWTLAIGALIFGLDYVACATSGGTRKMDVGYDLVTLLIIFVLWLAADFLKSWLDNRIRTVNRRNMEKADEDFRRENRIVIQRDKYLFNPEREYPAVHANTCNRDLVAGFKNKKTGEFREIEPLKDDSEIEGFARKCGVESVDKFY